MEVESEDELGHGVFEALSLLDDLVEDLSDVLAVEEVGHGVEELLLVLEDLLSE